MTERKELTAEEKARAVRQVLLPALGAAGRPSRRDAQGPQAPRPRQGRSHPGREQPARPRATPKGRTATASCPTAARCVALRHPMTGATPEMIDWWFAWHGLEDLRYKLWYPEMHVSARLDPEERAKVLDPARSPAAEVPGTHPPCGGGHRRRGAERGGHQLPDPRGLRLRHDPLPSRRMPRRSRPPT